LAWLLHVEDAMTNKKKRPGHRDEMGRTKQKTTGETESKATRPKQDHKGQGRGGAKARQAKES
jgi:hypothetical protein